MTSPVRNQSFLLTVLAVCVALVGSALVFSGSEGYPGVDFFQYWIVPKVLAVDPELNLYSDEGRKSAYRIAHDYVYGTDHELRVNAIKLKYALNHRPGELRLSSTPFAVALLGNFSGSNYQDNFTIFQAVWLAATVAALLLLGVTFRTTAVDRLLAAAGIFLCFEPLRADLRVGNVNQLQLLLIALFFAANKTARTFRGQLLSGGLLGLLFLFKPNLLLLPPFFALACLATGQIRKLLWNIGGGVLAGAGAIAYSSYYFGSARVWLDWLDIATKLSKGAGALYSQRAGNFSLPQTALESLNWPLPQGTGWLLAAVAGALVWRKGRALRAEQPDFQQMGHKLAYFELLAASVGIGMSLYVVSLVWVHYFLLIVPLFFATLTPLQKSNRSAAAVAKLSLAAPWIAVGALHGPGVLGGIVLDDGMLAGRIALAALSFHCGLILLLGAAVCYLLSNDEVTL